MIVVDAHEDLAWNALTFGRDIVLSVEGIRRREAETSVPDWNGHTLIGWPEWIRGRVGIVFASLFAAPSRWQEGPWDTQCYADQTEAVQLYRANLEVYRRWLEANPDKFAQITTRGALESVVEEWELGEVAEPCIGWILLMEGADALLEPAQAEVWYREGVRILGPAWAATAYAGGTGEPGPLTGLGRELLRELDALGMILDLSHLTEQGALEAIDRYQGEVIVSHTSPLACVPNASEPERHITDLTLDRLAERDSVMGLALWNPFLKDGWAPDQGREAVGLGDVARAIDYVCQRLGNANHIGIGSDFDGGFGLNEVPLGLDSVADLRTIGEALEPMGYTSEDIEKILGGNWLRVLRRALPETEIA